MKNLLARKYVSQDDQLKDIDVTMYLEDGYAWRTTFKAISINQLADEFLDLMLAHPSKNDPEVTKYSKVRAIVFNTIIRKGGYNGGAGFGTLKRIYSISDKTMKDYDLWYKNRQTWLIDDGWMNTYISDYAIAWFE